MFGPKGRVLKSTISEIRERFDRDVERFANLDTGQSATIDAPLALDLIAEAAAITTCGPGGCSTSAVGRGTTPSSSSSACRGST